MPLAYAAAMYRHVKNGTLMLERQVYGFFFSGFRAEIWWFELWNTLRKSLFTISAVLFACTHLSLAMYCVGSTIFR